MGTSTRRTYENAKKKIDEMLSSNDKIDINKLNKIISEVMYPKKGNSKMYTNISGSISSTEFCSSISNIIRISNTIRKKGISGLGISSYQNKSFNEKVQLLTDIISNSENPILKQTIVEVLSTTNESPELNLLDAIKCIFSMIKVFLRDKIESFIYEEAASKDQNFDDEKLQQDIDNELSKQIGITINIDEQNEILNNYENIPFLKKKFEVLGKKLLENIWG